MGGVEFSITESVQTLKTIGRNAVEGISTSDWILDIIAFKFVCFLQF